MDAIIQLTILIILFGSLFPLMGVPQSLIAPLFIGTQAMNALHLASSFGFRPCF